MSIAAAIITRQLVQGGLDLLIALDDGKVVKQAPGKQKGSVEFSADKQANVLA